MFQRIQADTCVANFINRPTIAGSGTTDIGKSLLSLMINSALTGTIRKSAAAPFIRTFAVPASFAGLLFMSGCALGGGGSGTVQVLQETPSPREIILKAGMSPPAACVVSVNQSPPAPKIEQQPKLPAKDAVWLEGNWRYYSGEYVWIPGHWAIPPKPHAVYEPPHWSVRNGNNMFTEGYWHF
ncbi:MAG TPA: YXWGXW repeat-containing protein [Rariglobus sp.]|jgi:hypothetical protein|nr:YXWGXW repeat-containing protein [Rariglobus sp.]